MSSYYPSFSHTAPNGMKYNSYKDKNLIVVHFESGDTSDMDTFLGMTPVYTDNAYGTRRLDYGAKYSNVAVIRISVIKADGEDFTVAEVRDFLRWTTGCRAISYLDLSDIVDGNEIVKASFLGRITAVYQRKLDARTVGFTIEHTSVSPYGYSPIRYANYYFTPKLSMNKDGVLIKDEQSMTIDNGGVLNSGDDGVFCITNNGTIYIDNSVNITINNYTDDLSDYVFLDTKFVNNTCDHLVITNKTLYDKSNGMDGVTEITGIHNEEIITLSSGQFIVSSSGKTFGDSFNFVWPKLLPGDNNFIIDGFGAGGAVEFSYRYPIKIGDCAMDISVSSSGLCCGDYSDTPGYASNYVTWDDILDKPTTIDGYGITDAYTISEVNNKIDNLDIDIDENELNQMLEDIFE